MAGTMAGHDGGGVNAKDRWYDHRARSNLALSEGRLPRGGEERE